MSNTLMLLLLLGGLGSSCQPSYVTVATVGSFTITKEDLSLREQVLRLSYPQYSGDITAAARNQLIESFSRAEILKNNGQSVTDDVLRKEAERIDKTTLMPDELAKIKAIFGSYQQSYLKLYILPVYVERVIYFEFFLHDKNVQAASLKRAHDFLNSMLQPGSPFVHKDKVRFTVSLERGLEFEENKNAPPGAPRPEVAPAATATATAPAPAPESIQQKLAQDKKTQESEEGRRWINDIISKLKPGGVHPQVVDQHSHWWVVRYLGKNKIEAAVFPKADFEEWLKAEKRRVAVREL